MTDLRDMELPGPWDRIVKAWRDGEQIDRNEVTRLLTSGEPVPVEANEFLAEAIKDQKERNFKFKRGNAPWYADNVLTSPRMVYDLVEGLKERILNPSLGDDPEQRRWLAEAYKKATRKHSHGERVPARKQAIEQVAYHLDLTPSHVETKIKEYNKELRQIAAHFGVTVREVKAAIK